jgi:GNAT superfamily N-acetyltransferase
VLVSGEVAGIHNVGTVPSARGIGVGRRLTAHAANAGRAFGATHAVLQTTPAGEPVYRGMGFSEVCVVERWMQR